MSFCFKSHTADVEIVVSASNLEEIFKESLKALNSYLKPKLKKGFDKKKFLLTLKNQDLALLLIDFLSEVLARTYIDKSIYQIEKIKLKKDLLKAQLKGRKFEKIPRDIKAITYHLAAIEKRDSKYQARFIIDV